MDGGFRHQGLEEIYRTGTDHIAKCEPILQWPEVAGKPEDRNVRGFRFHGLQGRPKRRVGARNWELPDHFRPVARKRFGCRF